MQTKTMRAQQHRRRKRYKRVGLILVVAISIVAAALVMGGSLFDADDGGEAGTSVAAVDDGGLDFAVETLDGGTFRLSDFRGQTVAIFAMAGWCGSCIPEAEAWAEIYPEYQARGVELLVLSVDPSDSKDQVANFRASTGAEHLPYWAIDRDGAIARLLEVRTLDQTMIIDPAGRLVFTDYAPTLAGQLRAALDDVLSG